MGEVDSLQCLWSQLSQSSRTSSQSLTQAEPVGTQTRGEGRVRSEGVSGSEGVRA